MRTLVIAASVLSLGACMQTTENAELREITRSNAEQATADARNIANETDPEGRAGNCYVFIGISRNLHSRGVGHDDAAMERAQRAYYDFLVRRLTKAGADQLIGSSVNPLTPADPAARDAASRYCVDHAVALAPGG